jgi:hypothetical protein
MPRAEDQVSALHFVDTYAARSIAHSVAGGCSTANTEVMAGCTSISAASGVAAASRAAELQARDIETALDGSAGQDQHTPSDLPRQHPIGTTTPTCAAHQHGFAARADSVSGLMSAFSVPAQVQQWRSWIHGDIYSEVMGMFLRRKMWLDVNQMLGANPSVGLMPSSFWNFYHGNYAGGPVDRYSQAS